jgi:hypothetical protein
MVFAETIGRIHAKLGQVQRVSIFLTRDVVTAIAVNLAELHPKEDSLSRTAWSTIFSFVIEVIVEKTCAIAFYSVPVFVSYFLSLFAEDWIEKFVLQSLTEYLSAPVKADDVSEFCAVLTAFCNTLFPSRMELDWRTAALPSLFGALARSVNSNPVLAPAFRALAHRELRLLFFAPSNAVFLSTLALFAAILHSISDFGFTDAELFQTAAALRTLEPTEEGLALLRALLAKQQSPADLFIIRTPAAVLLALAYGNWKTSIGFLSKLCAFSFVNCAKCHEGELDLFLLTALRNFGERFRFNTVDFENPMDRHFADTVAFPLLCRIASLRSSPAVAGRWFQLAIPGPGGNYLEIATTAM